MPILSDTTLTLLFTGGTKLARWAEVGSLDREALLYKHLAARLAKVNFVTYGGKADLQHQASVSPVHVLASNWRHRRQLGLLNRWSLWQRHAAALRDTDVFKTNQIPGADIAAWLKRKCRARLIVRCGFLWSLNFERESTDYAEIRRVRRLEREAFQAADIGVVTTPANLRHVVERHQIDPAKLRVVPNFVDVDRFRPSPKGLQKTGRRLCYIGRLSPEKNLGGLVSALDLLKSRGRPVSLTLIGNGKVRGDLEARVDRAGLDVTFVGNIPNAELPHRLWHSDAFVLPSRYENHPKALLEAMACGLPCIGTDVEGIRGEIDHGNTGYLCEGSPDALAHAIDRTLDDEDLRTRLSQGGRSHVVQHYALDRVMDLEIASICDALGITRLQCPPAPSREEAPQEPRQCVEDAIS